MSFPHVALLERNLKKRLGNIYLFIYSSADNNFSYLKPSEFKLLPLTTTKAIAKATVPGVNSPPRCRKNRSGNGLGIVYNFSNFPFLSKKKLLREIEIPIIRSSFLIFCNSYRARFSTRIVIIRK